MTIELQSYISANIYLVLNIKSKKRCENSANSFLCGLIKNTAKNITLRKLC